MPRSKIFLPDVNVWLALASSRHIHNQAAAHWFDGISEGEAVFCRVTQMALLRLLTNARVMGIDAVRPVEAWNVYQTLTQDSRVCFSIEPPGLERAWLKLTRRPQVAQNRWTDTYLQAFAALRELSIVTFDKGFRRFANPEALVLG
jgi:uncharacterized protein